MSNTVIRKVGVRASTLLALLSTAHLHAQGSPAASPLATISTDTGAFAFGYREFSRYTTPTLCAAAARRWRDRFRRTLEVQASEDSLQAMPVQDTQPSEVTRLARQCGSRFTVANTPTDQLQDLFTLALFEQNDPLAASVVARVVTVAKNSKQRAGNELQLLGSYLNDPNHSASFTDAAQPARVAAATALLAQIDARGLSALVERLQAHALLLRCWQRSHDTTQARVQADRLIALANEGFKAGGNTDTMMNYLAIGYHELQQQTFLTVPESLLVVGRRQLVDVNRMRAAGSQQDVDKYPEILMGKDSENLCISVQVGDNALLTREALRLIGAMPGGAKDDSAAARHLQTSVIFPAPREAAGIPLALPVPGAINLIIVWSVYRTWDGPSVVSHMRQLVDRYGAHGLVVTVLVKTIGERRRRGNFDVDAEALTPEAEADSLRWWLQTYLQLPVRVAVQENPVKFKPAPDGRRILASDLYESPRLLITGRDGKELMVYNTISGPENAYQIFETGGALETMIAAALTHSTAPGEPAPPSAATGTSLPGKGAP